MHIRNSKSIPERFKDDIINHLRKIPDLFCGSNYGFKSFPTSEFVHEIEFIDPSIKSLSAKPYPAAGIRLEQLKAALDKLEQEKDLLDLKISSLEEIDRNQKLIKALRGKPRKPKRKEPKEEKQKNSTRLF